MAHEAQQQYSALLREELSAKINGEVDEESWRAEAGNRPPVFLDPARNEGFRQYAKQSFIDTLTLYMHGICCDIDVETGPRQLPSRYLRKRLVLLRPVSSADGYPVFPEEIKDK